MLVGDINDVRVEVVNEHLIDLAFTPVGVGISSRRQIRPGRDSIRYWHHAQPPPTGQKSKSSL
jgi:hypothetical protein